jgi:hypothetical protein
MKLAGHIARKDLHRAWPWLALLILVVLCRSGVFALTWLGHLGENGTSNFGGIGVAEAADNVLFTLEILLGVLLVATIVQDDGLRGDRQFWTTRPISGLRLLAAKTIALAIAAFAIPVLLKLGWWVAVGFSWEQIQTLLGTFLGLQLLQLALAWVFAMLTRGIGEFLTAIVVALLCVTLFSFTTMKIGGSGAATSGGLSFSRIVLAFLAVGVAAVAALVLQYRTRRTARTLVVCIGTALIIVAIVRSWPWDISRWIERKPTSPAAGAPITLRIDRAWPHDAGNSLDIQFRSTGLPVGHLEAEFTVLNAYWTIGDKRLPAYFVPHWAGSFPASSLNSDSARPSLRRLTSRTPASDSEQYSGRVQLPPGWNAERLAAENPQLSVRLRGVLHRADVVAELTPDEVVARKNGHRTRVVEWTKEEQRGWAIQLHSLSPLLPRPNLGGSVYLQPVDKSGAAPPRATLSPGRSTVRSYSVGLVRLIWSRHEFEPGSTSATEPYKLVREAEATAKPFLLDVSAAPLRIDPPARR